MIDQPTDRRIDRQTDRQIDRWTDRQTDREINRTTSIQEHKQADEYTIINASGEIRVIVYGGRSGRKR